MTARELYDFLNSYTEIYSSDFNDIQNAVIDYMNDNQDFSLEYLFEDYVDYETIEYMAKDMLKEEEGLIRLYYFLGDANIASNDLWHIDGYGNLQDITQDDVRFLVEEIQEELKREL